jgi:hypothetical protein
MLSMTMKDTICIPWDFDTVMYIKGNPSTENEHHNQTQLFYIFDLNQLLDSLQPT